MSAGSSNVLEHEVWECPCGLCEIERRKQLAPGTVRGELNWSAMPGRIHVVEGADAPFFGMILTFAGASLLGLGMLFLCVTGGVVLAQAVRHAGFSGVALLHQLHARLS
ncbi:MAG TPA: hypothetical protein VII58_12620 [Acidobacteriaceae bacterium]